MFLRLPAIGILLCAAAVAAALPEFHVHDGDTVVFYGDSITNQRLYTVFAETSVISPVKWLSMNHNALATGLRRLFVPVTSLL